MNTSQVLLPGLQMAVDRYSAAQLLDRPSGPVPAARLRAVRDDPEAVRRLRHLDGSIDGRSLEAVLPEILNAALEVTGSELGDIQLADPETDALYLVTQRGFKTEFLDYFQIVGGDSTPCGRAGKLQGQIVTADVTQDLQFAPHLHVADAAGFRSCQCTPLLDVGRVVGMISTHFPRPHHPSARELRTMSLYAGIAGEAVATRLGVPADQHVPVTSMLGIRPRMGEDRARQRVATAQLCRNKGGGPAALAASGVVYDDGVLRIARIEPPPLGLLLTGEADETSYQPLVAALAQLPCGHASPAEVHLDLSGLQFCDAAALHAMIGLTGDGGRVVVLHNPPAPLQALIRITGWDEIPGLTLVNSPLPFERQAAETLRTAVGVALLNWSLKSRRGRPASSRRNQVGAVSGRAGLVEELILAPPARATPGWPAPSARPPSAPPGPASKTSARTGTTTSPRYGASAS